MRARAAAQESGASRVHCLRFIAYAALRNRDVAATDYDAAALSPLVAAIPNRERERRDATRRDATRCAR
jgi:hypothetical protein